MKALTKMLATVAMAALAACGGTEPNAPAGNGGDEPLAKVEGRIQGGNPTTAYVNPNVGLVWVAMDQTGFIPNFIEEVLPVDASTLPVSFSISVFSPPPVAALSEITDENGAVVARLAWGLAIAFEDRNGDHAFEMDEVGIVAPDLVFGASFFDTLIYIDSITPEAAAWMFENPAEATVGFHVARMDPCTGSMEFVSPTTPFVIDTFTPASNFDEGYPVIDCGGTGPCAVDETSEECTTCMDALATVCFEETCVGQIAALDACGAAHECGSVDPESIQLCLQLNCAAELDAYEMCLTGCFDPSPCFGYPTEE